MKEISMHILDIVMNSIKAKSSLIELLIEESIKNNIILITIKDNGMGMSGEMTKLVTDPFFTTRITRKIGLGLPMLKEACERCNGFLEVKSEVGKGTIVKCSFEINNIDRAPLGNMGDTIMTIINSLDNCEFIYKHNTDNISFYLNSAEIYTLLDGGSIKDCSVLIWIKDYVNENIRSISNI